MNEKEDKRSLIIDSITHVTPDGQWFQTHYDASELRLIQEMESAGVARAVVVALAGYISNDFVLKVCRRHPDRLIPGASFNPAAYTSENQAASEFRAQLKDTPFQVLKLHPRINQYDPLDPRCFAILSELSSWDTSLPVWIDSLFYYKGGSLRKSLVDSIHDIVNCFPSIDFVLLHAGGSWVLQLAESIRDCPNTYLDISHTLFHYVNSSVWLDLHYLLHTFDRRMVFGSDFPEISIDEAVKLFWNLAKDVPIEKCKNVLSNNLSKLITLE